MPTIGDAYDAILDDIAERVVSLSRPLVQAAREPGPAIAAAPNLPSNVVSLERRRELDLAMREMADVARRFREAATFAHALHLSPEDEADDEAEAPESMKVCPVCLQDVPWYQVAMSPMCHRCLGEKWGGK